MNSEKEVKLKQIYNLITPFVKQNLIVNRTIEQLSEDIDNFITMKINQEIVACCGVREHTNINEVYCLAVNVNFHHQGLSKQLLQKVKSATKKDIIALSKYKGEWFIKQGFQKVGVEQLPITIKYDYSRKPSIFKLCR